MKGDTTSTTGPPPQGPRIIVACTGCVQPPHRFPSRSVRAHLILAFPQAGGTAASPVRTRSTPPPSALRQKTRWRRAQGARAPRPPACACIHSGAGGVLRGSAGGARTNRSRSASGRAAPDRVVNHNESNCPHAPGVVHLQEGGCPNGGLDRDLSGHYGEGAPSVTINRDGAYLVGAGRYMVCRVPQSESGRCSRRQIG